jgi:hypothetical protein
LSPLGGTTPLADPVSEAIVVWTGWGETSWPAREEGRLVERYGPENARELAPVLSDLYRQFYESDAAIKVPDLSAATKVAADRFARLHPELTAEAVKALAWCYSFDWR